MSTTIKLLIVEHDPHDIELMEYELRKGGIDYTAKIVQNEPGYRDALKNFVPDIILSDYSFPSFDGPKAFKIKQQVAADTPFILVSGYIGEENSIELIKNGVTDYVLKDKLFTLCIKFRRALKESSERQLKNKAEQESVQSEVRLAKAQQVAHLGSWELDSDGDRVLLSGEACRIYGLPSHQHLQPFDTWLSFIHPEDYDFVSKKVRDAQEALRSFSFYYRIMDAGGFVRHIYSEHELELNLTGELVCTPGIKQGVNKTKVPGKKVVNGKQVSQISNAVGVLKKSKPAIPGEMYAWPDEMYKTMGIEKGDVSSSMETYSSYIHPDDPKKSYERIEEAFKILQNPFFEFRFIRTDAVRYGYCEWKFEFGNAGNAERIFGVIQDVTQRKRAELERIKIVNDLIQRNKDLEQFAYIVSHNLRAPIANILGAASGLDYPWLSAEEKIILSKGLRESVTNLDNVVKDLSLILQVKLETNEIKEKVMFSKLVEDIKIGIKNLIENSDIEIKYDFSESDEFLTIKSYLYSIFYNLISNSIRYRQQNIASVIEIKSHQIKNKIEIIFNDNGLGIDLEKRREQVFGLYKRFHANIEGKGMGLFMVKTQVETLGGKIGVRSEVNKGTEFKIEFEI